MIDWIIENKEWALSGFAIAVPLFLLSLLPSKGKKSFSQKSGDNSINIQANGNVNVKKKK